MTQAQDEAMAKALEILREHFDASVLVVLASSEDLKSDTMKAGRHGGIANGLGLIKYAEEFYVRDMFEEGERTE